MTLRINGKDGDDFSELTSPFWDRSARVDQLHQGFGRPSSSFITPGFTRWSSAVGPTGFVGRSGLASL